MPIRNRSSPASAAKIPDAVFAAMDLAVAAAVDYVPDRIADRPGAPTETYRVLEDTYVLTRSRPESSCAVNAVSIWAVFLQGLAHLEPHPFKILGYARDSADKLHGGRDRRELGEVPDTPEVL